MNPLVKIFLRIFLIIIAILFIIQPINWFCTLTNKCKTINFSYYFPKKEGAKPLNFIIGATSRFHNVDFYTEDNFINTFAGKKHKVKFTMHNRSKTTIYMLPKMKIEPKEASKYINRYQCPCMQRHKLKPNQKLNLEMEFDADIEIEEVEEVGNDKKREIKILFEI
jgi:cytochrome c oxidase assembly protein Cox11